MSSEILYILPLWCTEGSSSSSLLLLLLLDIIMISTRKIIPTPARRGVKKLLDNYKMYCILRT